MTVQRRAAWFGFIVIVLVGAAGAWWYDQRFHELPPAAQLASSYRFLDPKTDDGFKLELLDDQSARLDEFDAPDGQQPLKLDGGRWDQRSDGDAVIATFRDNVTATIVFDRGFPATATLKDNDGSRDFPVNSFTLGSGDQQKLVNTAEERLRTLGYLTADDGEDKFDEDVRKATEAFQESQGLTPTGAIDLTTWKALQSPKKKPEPKKEDPKPAPKPQPKPEPEHAVNPPEQTEGGGKVVYLTFDDGPHGTWTPQVLELLKQYEASATFFVLGEQVGKYKELVRSEASAGHYIGNHTVHHDSLKGDSEAEFRDAVEPVRTAILAAAGDLFTLDKDVRYLRPPYGAMDSNTRAFASQLGYKTVLWDIDTQDWRRPGADQIASHVLDHVKSGDIVLMHDAGGDRSQTVEALKTVLPKLKEQGYSFRTVFADQTLK